MKIIEKKKKQVWSEEVTCTANNYFNNSGPGCGSKILLEEGDIYYSYREHNFRSGRKDGYFKYFRCPSCNVINIIKNIPNYVHKKEKGV